MPRLISSKKCITSVEKVVEPSGKTFGTIFYLVDYNRELLVISAQLNHP